MIIKIKNLYTNTYLGIYDWEKERRRQVVYNIEMEIDGSKVRHSHNIEDTIDYDVLSQKIIEFTEVNRFEMIETLADQVLEIIMNHPLVQKATLEVDKPNPRDAVDSISVVVRDQK